MGFIVDAYEAQKKMIEDAKHSDRSGDLSANEYEPGEREEEEIMDAVYKAMVAHENDELFMNDDSPCSFEMSEFAEEYAKVKEIGPSYYVYDSLAGGNSYPLDECRQKLNTIKYDLHEYFEERGIISEEQFPFEPGEPALTDQDLLFFIEHGNDIANTFNERDEEMAKNQLEKLYNKDASVKYTDIYDLPFNHYSNLGAMSYSEHGVSLNFDNFGTLVKAQIDGKNIGTTQPYKYDVSEIVLSQEDKKKILDKINKAENRTKEPLKENRTASVETMDIQRPSRANVVTQKSIDIAKKVLESVRSDIDRSIRRLDELSLSPGISEQGAKIKEENIKVQNERA